MPGRLIAIGDIHGCANALRCLMTAIDPVPADTIVPLGDVIDRGPDSRGVLEQLIAWSAQCVLKPVLGNHEEMLLAVLRGEASPLNWIRFGGAATLESYGFTGDLSVIPPDHVQFLETFADFVETDDHFFVHANYESRVPLPEQSPRWLRWVSLEEFLPAPHASGKLAIVGHTPDRTGEIFSVRHLKCIDTYCYGGQWLTALDIGAGTIWQAQEDGTQRQSSLGKSK